jgi:hypothetical protein
MNSIEFSFYILFSLILAYMLINISLKFKYVSLDGQIYSYFESFYHKPVYDVHVFIEKYGNKKIFYEEQSYIYN